ncbi:MAG TPA: UbiD family decarboxylase [Candidatus Acidoferrales bacterium]|nr:UbiD family decarboxylase [Candidatus Acidoferrales bacterium]
MEDLRLWLKEVEALGQLKRVGGADANLEIGVITEINGQRRGPALLFDGIPGFERGFRILTGSILNAKRLALAFGYRDIETDHELISRLEGKMAEFERSAPEHRVREVTTGPVLQHRYVAGDVNLLRLPAPKWHAHDGGQYLGTGCIVITKDPDSGRVNFGSYRLMLHDRKTVTLHISSAHHGAINVKKFHDRGEAAPIAVSLGHHPLYLVIAGMGLPYGVSEYEFLGAVRGERVSVVRGEITGLPIPADSEIALEGFCPPNEFREEGPFGEYTGYYASGKDKEPILDVRALYHRDDPINLGAPPGRPPHDYSYVNCLMKSLSVKESLVKDGIPDVKGVWYHEAAGVNFFVVVSIRQRYPGHARQAGFVAAQCQAAGNHLGRYVVVVDEDIDPTDLNEVIWAIGTRSNPERDIDIIRNTYSSPLDPIYPKQGKIAFGSRAIIDACRPYDWIRDFPRVVQSTPEEKQKVIEKWREIFG